MPSVFIGKKNAINNLYENAININSNYDEPNFYTPTGANIPGALQGIDNELGVIKANFPVVSVTGSATVNLALTDKNTIQSLDNATTITVNIPTNASVAFPANGATIINFIQINTGQLNFVPAGGVTLLSYLSRVTTAGQYAQCSLVKLDTNVWMLTGALI